MDGEQRTTQVFLLFVWRVSERECGNSFGCVIKKDFDGSSSGVITAAASASS